MGTQRHGGRSGRSAPGRRPRVGPAGHAGRGQSAPEPGPRAAAAAAELGRCLRLEHGALGPGQRQAAVPAGALLGPRGVHQPPARLVLLRLRRPAVHR